MPSQTPWDQDASYQALVAEHATAMKAIEGMQGHEAGAEDARIAAEAAAAKVRIKQQELHAEAVASGTWTEQDDRTLEAHRSLAEKAKRVTAMFEGSPA